MTNRKLLMGMLVMAFLLTGLTSQNAFAVITNVSGVSSDTVGLSANNVNSLKVYWTDANTDDEPTDGALVTHYVEISNDSFTSIIESVDVGNGAGVHTFNGLNPATLYDVRVIAEFATAGNQTAVTSTGTTNTDSEDPIVTGSTTNVNDGGNTELTATDQYAESCTATDNDTNFVDNCSVQSGSIDTGSLGLQSVTYVATDPSSNDGTDTVSTTVVDTTSPVFGGAIPSQNGQVNILFTDNESGVSATDIQSVVISAELFAPNATSIQTVADISVGTISFTPDIDGTWTITYTATDSSLNSATSDKDVIIATNGVPVITDSVGDESKSLNTVYSVTGFTATDLEDGSLTNNIALVVTSPSLVITNKVGSDQPFDITLDELGAWTITADVNDSDTNSALTVTRTITVGVGNFPVITIAGASEMIPFKTDYVTPTASCSDVEDGVDFVTGITPTGSVGSLAGSYTLTYACTDSSGNTSSDSITVTRLASTGGSGDDKFKNAPTYGKLINTNNQFVLDGFKYGLAHLDDSQLESVTVIDNFHTPFDMITIETGVPYKFITKGYFSYGFASEAMCFGISETGKGHEAETCIDVYAEDVKVSQKTEVIDTSSLVIERTKASCNTEESESCDEVKYIITFLEPLQHKVMMLQGIDQKRFATNTYLNEGADVSGKQFTELPSAMIVSPVKYEGLIKVTQSEKYSKIWTADDGREFAKNDYGSFTWINQSFERPQDDGNMTNRNHYAYANYKEKLADMYAEKYLDSSDVQGIDKGFIPSPERGIDHRELTLQKLVWNQ